jgi:hypothetical protein
VRVTACVWKTRRKSKDERKGWSRKRLERVPLTGGGESMSRLKVTSTNGAA